MSACDESQERAPRKILTRHDLLLYLSSHCSRWRGEEALSCSDAGGKRYI